MVSTEFVASYEHDASGIAFLVVRANVDFAETSPIRVIASIPIVDFCEAAGAAFNGAATVAGVAIEGAAFKGAAPGGSAKDFSDPRKRLVLANGWQSWSFAGELRRNERPRRAALKRALNLYVDHPAEEELRALAKSGRRVPGFGRPNIVSHFFVVLRAGRARLALVSHNASGEGGGSGGGHGGSGGAHDSSGNNRGGGRALPPVTFFVGREKIRVAVSAEGGSFRAGETVARIAIVAGSDYFALKDKLAGLFGAADRFASLRFLGVDPSRRESIGGFETWYNHYLDIDEAMILRDLETLGSNGNLVNALFLEKGKPVVFQIDDGWENRVGDWLPNEKKFPNGVACLAARVEAKGLIPGLWIAPFLLMPDSLTAHDHPSWLLKDARGRPVRAAWNPGWGGEAFCLDIAKPDVIEYLLGLFDTIINVWGFRYLKLDFLYAGMLRGAAPESRRAGESLGYWERYMDIMSRITSVTKTKDGKPVAWLACGAPFECTAPLMPLMRVGADTREHWDWPILRLIGHQGRPSAKVNLGHTFARSLLDGTLLLNDPDVVFCRGSNTTLADSEKFLIALSARMFASQLLTSDDPSEFGPSKREFTGELLALFEKLGSRDFGVERYSLADPDL
ncbi:MAG: glycoside hydrolase family 36 protein, partial [Spirochaetales bacterium]